MRIIAGDCKGRALESPDWPGLRPTSDRLRETLFNVLAPVVRGARFLDGYAGTGAVGIEALSRGADYVLFVEQDARAAGLIAGNLKRCGIDDRHAIIRVGFARAAGSAGPVPFDIIFLDPPYGGGTLLEAIDAAAPLVGIETRLIIEHARRDEAPEERGGLVRVRVLRSGDSALSFYRRNADGPADLAVRGPGRAWHRDGRGARRTRRDEREYLMYLNESQRRPPGCRARRMPRDLDHGLPGHGQQP